MSSWLCSRHIRGWAIYHPGLWSDYCISCVKTAPTRLVCCWLHKALWTEDSLYDPHASTHSFVHWTPCEVILAGSGVDIGSNDTTYPVLNVRYCELYSRGRRVIPAWGFWEKLSLSWVPSNGALFWEKNPGGGGCQAEIVPLYKSERTGSLELICCNWEAAWMAEGARHVERIQIWEVSEIKTESNMALYLGVSDSTHVASPCSFLFNTTTTSGKMLMCLWKQYSQIWAAHQQLQEDWLQDL